MGSRQDTNRIDAPIKLDIPMWGRKWNGDHWIKMENNPILMERPRNTSIRDSPVEATHPATPMIDHASIAVGGLWTQWEAALAARARQSCQEDPVACSTPAKILDYGLPELGHEGAMDIECPTYTEVGSLSPSLMEYEDQFKPTADEWDNVLRGSSLGSKELLGLVESVALREMTKAHHKRRRGVEEETPPAKRRFLEFPLIRETTSSDTENQVLHRGLDGKIEEFKTFGLTINPPHEVLVYTDQVNVVVLPRLPRHPTIRPLRVPSADPQQ